jgi:acetyl esterase/lipase
MALDTNSMRRFGPTTACSTPNIVTWFRDCYVCRRTGTTRSRARCAGRRRSSATLVVVGEIDPLLDDGVKLAKRLEQAGRKVVLQTHAGMPHDFMLFPGIDEGARAIDGICRFAKSALGG